MSIPIKLLNEAQGHIVTLELSNGDTYRGKLVESEDNMNMQLRDVTLTPMESNKGITRMDNVFIRGSQIRFITLPDMLKHAPLFKKQTLKPQPPIRGPINRGRG